MLSHLFEDSTAVWQTAYMPLSSAWHATFSCSVPARAKNKLQGVRCNKEDGHPSWDTYSSFQEGGRCQKFCLSSLIYHFARFYFSHTRILNDDQKEWRRIMLTLPQQWKAIPCNTVTWFQLQKKLKDIFSQIFVVSLA